MFEKDIRKMKEGRNIDYKVTLDISSEREKLELIKDIVAISNSGGGEIIFGKNEKSMNGIDDSILEVIDSAKCADQIKKFTGISTFDLQHHIEKLNNERYICTLTIPKSLSLIVMSRIGVWNGFNHKKDKALFNTGDIWVRHSSKTERISNDFLQKWIDEIKTNERDRILNLVTTFVKVPEGSTVEIISSKGESIKTSNDLLVSACHRRKRDHSHLLNGKDLLWIYQNREITNYNNEVLRLLIASSLRRNATLYWWLTLLDDSKESRDLIVDELNYAIQGNDRDKSDASRMVIELGSIYADDLKLNEIIDSLKKSRYSHFRESAELWTSRQQTLDIIYDRIKKVKSRKNILYSQPLVEIEFLSMEVASQLYHSNEYINSKKLGDINRVIWFKRKAHLLSK